jgi:hypothetical protein
MPGNNPWIKTLVTSFLYGILGFHAVLAQVSILIPSAPPAIKPGSIVNLNVLLENAGSTRGVSLTLDHPQLQILSDLPVQLRLEKQRHQMLPLTFLVPKQIVYGQALEVHIRLTDTQSGARIAEKTIFLSVLVERKLSAYLESPDLYLTNPGVPPSLVLHLRNGGNVPEDLHYRVYLSGDPNRIASKGMLHLNAHGDSILKTTLAGISRENALYILELSRPGGDVVYTALCHVHDVQNPGGLSPGWNPPTPWAANQIGLFANYASTGYNYYELTGDKTIRNTNNTIRLSVDGLYYSSLRQWDLRSAFIGIESKTLSLNLGSMTRNYDLWMTGRGAEVTLGAVNERHAELGYMNSRFDLSSPLSWNDSLSTQTLYGYYTQPTSRTGFLGLGLYYQRNPLIQEQDGIGALHWMVFHSPVSTLSFTVGGSSDQDISGKGGQKSGALGGISYGIHFPHWSLQTDNLYGTPYYAGIYRGTFQSDDRIDFYPDRSTSFYARYYENDAQPQYLHEVYNSLFLNLSQRRAEAGINVGSDALAQASAGYAFDQGKGNGLGGGASVNPSGLGSTLLSSNLFVASVRLNQGSFFMSNDMSTGAFSTNQLTFSHYFGFRDLLNLSYKYGYLYGMVQQGPFYLGDVVQQSLSGKFYTLYSLSPGLGGYLLHQRLYLKLSDQVATGSVLEHWTQNLNAQADYGLPGGLILHGALVHLGETLGGFGTYTQGQVGIIKRFKGGNYSTMGIVRMHLYEDLDHNFIPDRGDMPAGKLLVSLDGEVQMSDAKGRVRFRNISPGKHAFQVLGAGQWAVTGDSLWIGRHHPLLHIGLHRVSVLSGRIVFPTPESTPSNLSGILFQATDMRGKTFSAVCDGAGNFNFYLPGGDYAIQVQPTTLPDDVLCVLPEQWVTVLPESANQIQFKARIKEKKINMKRFNADGVVIIATQ